MSFWVHGGYFKQSYWYFGVFRCTLEVCLGDVKVRWLYLGVCRGILWFMSNVICSMMGVYWGYVGILRGMLGLLWGFFWV